MSTGMPTEPREAVSNGERRGHSASRRTIAGGAAVAAVIGGLAGAFPSAVPVLARPWFGPLLLALVVWLAITSLPIGRAWPRSRRANLTAWLVVGVIAQAALFGMGGFCHYRTLATAATGAAETAGPVEILKRLDLTGSGAPDEAQIAAAARASVEAARRKRLEQASFAGFCRHRYRALGRIPIAGIWLATLGEWIASVGLLVALGRRAESTPGIPAAAS